MHLEIVQLRGHLGGRADGHDHTPDPFFLDVVEHPVVARRALRREVAEHPRHDQLPSLLADGHLPKRALYPSGSGIQISSQRLRMDHRLHRWTRGTLFEA